MSEPVLESAAAPLQQHAHRYPMCKNSHREKKKKVISVISSQGDTELGCAGHWGVYHYTLYKQ